MTEYTCPRCAEKFLQGFLFLKNAGYMDMGICTECETPEEGVIITKIWKDYCDSTGIGVKNA